MLARDGYLEINEIRDIPGYPGTDVLSQKKCVVVECSQNIPCNPCEAACPHGAITVGEPITNLPVVDKDKCIGCGLCVAKCPGQAIFLVDQTSGEYDTVTLPYEYYPLPKKEQEVYCLSRAGKFLTKGNVARIVMAKVNDRTAVVWMYAAFPQMEDAWRQKRNLKNRKVRRSMPLTKRICMCAAARRLQRLR